MRVLTTTFHSMKKIICFSCLFLILYSCAKSPIDVESISISKTTAELVEGENLILSATVSPSNAEYGSISWSSTNSSVATVKDGQVTAIKEGSASITASAGGKSSSCAITVKKALVSVESISLDKTSAEMTEGDKLTLVATILPANATDNFVQWSSSDTSVATVSNGEVVAVSPGTVEIRAELGGKTAKCSIIVNKRIISVESIALQYSKKRLKIAESYQLSVSVIPADANNYELSFSSGNTAVATVDENGQVMGVSKGSTTVTVEADGKTATCIINVFEKDVVYAATMVYDYNTYHNVIWKDGIEEWSRDYFQIIDFDLSSSKSKNIYGIYDGPSKMNSIIIRNGEDIYLDDIDNEKSNHIEALAFSQNSAYSLVAYVTPTHGYRYGIWKDIHKVVDFADNGLISEYSEITATSICVDGDDTYVAGCLYEPRDANNRDKYPTVWKNGKIYKKFGPYDINDQEIGCFYDIKRVNGKCYMLMNSEHSSSIWDEDGQLYSAGGDKLYVFDGELYSTGHEYNDDASTVSATVYKGRDKLFNLDGVENLVLDYVDGDIYSVAYKREKKGGNYYYSTYIYRNEKEEYKLIETTNYTNYVRAIHVFQE